MLEVYHALRTLTSEKPAAVALQYAAADVKRTSYTPNCTPPSTLPHLHIPTENDPHHPDLPLSATFVTHSSSLPRQPTLHFARTAQSLIVLRFSRRLACFPSHSSAHDSHPHPHTCHDSHPSSTHATRLRSTVHQRVTLPLPPSLHLHPNLPALLPDIFQDLESRFLLNLPDSELSSFPRLFFQLQQAHWFYCDFYYDTWPQQLPAYNNLKTFCSKFFTLSPLLSSQLSRFEGLYDSFTTYLQSVPVCGVILLNGRLDRVLMVRGWKGNSWSFPKGKIDANESELQCAVRECREEVGYEVREGEVGDGDWIEAAVNGKSVKLFMVSGVDEHYNFETRTRKEISGIEWVDVATLPSYRDSGRAVGGGGGEEDKKRERKFWNVIPFVDEAATMDR